MLWFQVCRFLLKMACNFKNASLTSILKFSFIVEPLSDSEAARLAGMDPPREESDKVIASQPMKWVVLAAALLVLPLGAFAQDASDDKAAKSTDERLDTLESQVKTIAGDGLSRYTQDPKLKDGAVEWVAGPTETLNEKIVRPIGDPFQPTGGLKRLAGNLGNAVTKVSAVKPEHHIVEAPIRVFHDQESVKDAYRNGEFNEDVIVVVRFQGPKANGMPELHSLTPVLANLQARGLKVALVTDGRMSGASGKVPSAIHVSPEAANGGPLARVRDGDVIRVDAVSGAIECLAPDFDTREPVKEDLQGNGHGVGRELFAAFRANVGLASNGAAVVV